jgi:chitin disaccharide deacetylase
MQSLIINADDFAMDEAVDAGILRLAELGVVTATSAMALAPRWPEAARALRDAAPLSVGLHFDMTSAFSDSGFTEQGLSALLLRAQARLLNRGKLKREAERQLSAFDSAWGAPPAFVDGHQHVHHLPGIREALLDALWERYGGAAKCIGLRIAAPRRWRGLKAAIVAAAGAGAFARMAAGLGHPVNTDFAGVYDLTPGAELPALWKDWAAGLKGQLPLIMCHVATEAAKAGPPDTIRPARLREFEWLASAEFHSLLKQAGLSPAGWPRA